MLSYIVGIQFIAVITCLVFITGIMFHKPFRGRHIFILLCLAITMHCYGYYLELTSTTVEAAINAIKIAYLGISYINILYLFFLCDYFHIKRPKLIMLIFLAFNTFIFILVMTCEKHTLYYTSIDYSYDSIFPHVVLGKGVFYHLFQTEVLIVNILIAVVLLYRFIRSNKSERKREFHFILASLFTCITCTLYGLGVFSIYDPSSSSYVVSGLLMLISIYKDQLFDVIHSARDIMIESMEEAFIVIDTKNHILDRNMSAVRLFPKLESYTSETTTKEISLVLEDLFEKKLDCKFRLEERYYESHINDIYNGKEVVGYSALFIDITSTQEYTEDLINMRKQAEAANEAKSMFLANISHEIRTPLNAVLGMTDLILNEDINEEVRDDAISIKSAGNTLLKLMDDILDLSKIESGKLIIHESKYQLMDVLDDVIRMTRLKLKEKPVALIFNFSKDLPLYVYGDEIRIRQVLSNILLNAVKFTNHGEITFTVDCNNENNHTNLIFIIKDTGCGIEKEDLYNIFNSFERSRKAILDGVEGTGLGLAICKKIVETMGGTIAVESIYGMGSAFTITIPQKLYRKQNALEAHSIKFLDNPIDFNAKDAHALIVDDNSLNLKVVYNLLKQFKINVEQAQSGKECISFVEKNKYDIVFLDYMMPEMDGLETLQQIRLLDGAGPEELPVVVLTANAISGVKEQLLSEGFSDYLSKPINLHDLGSMLKKWLPSDKLQSIISTTKTTRQERTMKNNTDDDHLNCNADENLNSNADDNLNSNTDDNLNSNTDENYLNKNAYVNYLNSNTYDNYLNMKSYDNNIDNDNINIMNMLSNISKNNTQIYFEIGLQNCANIKSYYTEALHLYCIENASTIESLLDSLKNNNIKQFEIQIHGLKSVAKTLGALSLSEIAADLEIAAECGDINRINSLIDEFLCMNTNVIQTFETYLASN